MMWRRSESYGRVFGSFKVRSDSGMRSLPASDVGRWQPQVPVAGLPRSHCPVALQLGQGATHGRPDVANCSGIRWEFWSGVFLHHLWCKYFVYALTVPTLNELTIQHLLLHSLVVFGQNYIASPITSYQDSMTIQELYNFY